MKSSSSIYFSRLDHLRFLAALLVLVWHGTHYSNITLTSYVPAWPLSLFEEGHTGVALFMTLSGFIFQALCRGHKIEYFAFIRNRLLRIAPLFAVWTLLLFYTSEIEPDKLFAAIVALLDRGTVPGVGWTIIIEFQFYLIFPFLILFSRKYGVRYLAYLVLLALVLRLGVWATKGTIQNLSYWTIFGRVDQFLLGMIGCELYHRHSKFLGNPAVLLGLVAGWLGLYHVFNVFGGFYGMGAYPSRSSLWVGFPTLEGMFYSLITASYLSSRVTIPGIVDRSLAWLGALSYSFYLNHFFVIENMYKLSEKVGLVPVGFGEGLVFALLVCLPVLTLLSMATYNLIELPFLSLRKGYLGPMLEQTDMAVEAKKLGAYG